MERVTDSTAAGAATAIAAPATTTTTTMAPAPAVTATAATTSQRLVGRQVRLIHLKNLEENGSIICESSIADLDHHPRYSAVSYAWGVLPASVSVVCDGKNVSVTKSLAEALVQIWTRDPLRRLWADALAINQQDTDERSHQVGLMGDIFYHATTVYVWLGASDEAITQFIRSIWRQPDKEPPGREVRIGDFADGLKSLAARNWFYRAWTFQEIRMANMATVLCGTHQVHWPDFVDQVREGRRVAGDMYGTLRGFFVCLGIEALDFVPGTGDAAEGSLLALLTALWPRESEDPRDKVFAVLNSRLSRHAHRLRPNYALSWTKVYAQTTRACINDSRSLVVLKLAGSRGLQSMSGGRRPLPGDLPSWAVDWRAISYRAHRFPRFKPENTRVMLGSSLLGLPKWLDVQDTGPMLALRGVALGQTYFPEAVNGVDDVGPRRSAAVPPERKSLFLPFIQHTRSTLEIPWIAVTIRPMPHKDKDAASTKYSDFSGPHVAMRDFAASLMPDTDVDEYPMPNDARIEAGDWVCILEGLPEPCLLRPAHYGANPSGGMYFRLVGVFPDLSTVLWSPYPDSPSKLRGVYGEFELI